jgi:WD40 repeat protein
VHQDDISDLHVCQGPKKNLVATGEVGKKSTIHIWDKDKMKAVSSFSLGGSAKGIAALSISPCQRYVACVDSSNDHNMSIFNISKSKMIIQVSAGTDPIHDICWSKKPNDLRFSAVTTRSL